jgi:mannose-1-phosphate guanylyltransferase
MKAMILAAGKGTRVRPITYTIPKPLIPILQKPVMEFLLELLRQHGFDQVVVNVSHLADEIESYFRDGQRFGVQIAYSLRVALSMVNWLGRLSALPVGCAGSRFLSLF